TVFVVNNFLAALKIGCRTGPGMKKTKGADTQLSDKDLHLADFGLGIIDKDRGHEQLPYFLFKIGLPIGQGKVYGVITHGPPYFSCRSPPGISSGAAR